MACESKNDRALKSCDNGEVASARADLGSLLIKKGQALVDRATLKRTSSELMNMAAKLLVTL